MPAGRLVLYKPKAKSRSLYPARRGYRRRRRTAGVSRAPTFRSLRRIGGGNSMSQKFIRYATKLMPWVWGNTTVGQQLVFGSFEFKLSDLTQVSEFTQLYDSYMITKVILHISPHWSEAGIGIGRPYLPHLGFFLDYDENVSPTSESEFQQRPGYKYMPLDKQIHISLRPRPAGVVQTGNGGTVVTATQFGKRQWIDLANTAVEHYGFKYMIDNSGSKDIDVGGVTQTGPLIKVNCEYHIMCKGMR